MNNQESNTDDVVINFDTPNEDGLKNNESIDTTDQLQQDQSQTQQDKNQSEDLKSIIFNKLGVSNSTNPIICLAHIFFKALSIFVYLFSGLIFNSITIFIFVSIFCVLDFWVVKNLSGRILAGLRWWRVIDQEGQEKWMFESKDNNTKANPIDSAFFWYGQILNFLFWFFMSFIKLITLNLFWFILTFAALALCGTNLYAYYMCRKDHKSKAKDVLGDSVSMGKFVFGGLKHKLGI